METVQRCGSGSVYWMSRTHLPVSVCISVNYSLYSLHGNGESLDAHSVLISMICTLYGTHSGRISWYDYMTRQIIQLWPSPSTTIGAELGLVIQHHSMLCNLFLRVLSVNRLQQVAASLSGQISHAGDKKFRIAFVSFRLRCQSSAHQNFTEVDAMSLVWYIGESIVNMILPPSISLKVPADEQELYTCKYM